MAQLVKNQFSETLYKYFRTNIIYDALIVVGIVVAMNVGSC